MNKVIAKFGTQLESVLHGDHHIITTVAIPDGTETLSAGVLLYKDAGVYKPLKKADTAKNPVAVLIDGVEGPTSSSVANVAVHGAVRTEKLMFADGGPVTQAVVDKLLAAGIYALGGLPTEAVEPVITVQPNPTSSVTQNESVILSVGAVAPDGGSLTYEWYKNTANNTTSGTAMPGEDGASVSVDTSGIGTLYYYVKVTNTKNNTSKTVTSAVASVEVTA